MISCLTQPPVLEHETAWDLGPFAAALQCLRENTLHLPSYENTKKVTGTKNSCVHVQLVQISDKKTQKEQKNPTARSEKSGTKTGCQEQWPPKEWAKTPKPSLDTLPPLSCLRNQLTSPWDEERKIICSSSSLLHQGPYKVLVSWNFLSSF